MKKIKNIALSILCCCLIANLKSQPYGQRTYAHAQSILSTGSVTTQKPGFLMAGYSPSSPGVFPNFYIDRTDAGGLFNGMPWEFAYEYKINADQNCSGTLSEGLRYAFLFDKELPEISGSKMG